MRRPDIVLFDLGGVLLPFDPSRRIRAVARELAIAEATALAALSNDLFARLDVGAATCRDFAASFSEACGRPIEEEQAEALILSVFEAPNDALWTLARRLRKQVIVGGFSDNPPFVESMFPPGAELDPMFWSAELEATKASDAAFAAVEAQLGVPPHTILLVDDSLANISGARRRGWDAIHFQGNDALIAEFAARGLP